MKISSVTPFLLRGDEVYGTAAIDGESTDQGDCLLLVRVVTDAGIEAWADVETLGPLGEQVIAGQGMHGIGFRTLAEELVGRDPLEGQRLWDEMYMATAYYGRRGVAMHCLSAIDNCLWSIRAQAAGLPLSDLLGGRQRDRLPAYASTLFRSTPQQNADSARQYIAKGFRGVKFGWGGFGMDAVRDRDNLEAIREALGPDGTLMVDPGWFAEIDGRPRGRTQTETLTMLAVLAEFNPYWIEDFLHPEQVGEYARWKQQFPSLRFAAGEQQSTATDFAVLFDAGIDVLQPDLSRCGGLTVAGALVDRAAAAGVEIVTHSWLTDLLHGYSLQFLACLPTASWVEFNVAQSVLSRGVSATRMTLAKDGTVAVPTGVGLGVDVDVDFIEKRASWRGAATR